MYKLRRNNLIKSLEDQSITILFSGLAKFKTADQFFSFEINRNFFYLTGLNEAQMALVLIKSQNKVSEFIFKEIRSKEQALWDGELLSSEEVSKISGIVEVKDIKTLETFISNITSTSRANVYGKLGLLNLDLETNHLDSESYKLQKLIQEKHPYLKIENIASEISELRMIKDSHEVNQIVEAIKVTELGLNQIIKTIKAGMYEYQVQAEFEHVLAYHNLKTSFDTIAASGHNATILHYVDNSSQIKDGDLMLFDLGVKFNNYASDISRTYPVNGKFSSRQKAIYELVLKANKETIKILKPGVTWQEFNRFAKDILAEGLVELGVMETKEEISKYYYHSIGHFLGLDVHDVGNYQKPLEAGMIVTVEPGVYISEENIGIRIEDNILITKEGNINLSKDIIKEVKDIEAFMK